MDFESLRETIVLYGGKIILAIIFFIIARLVITKVINLLKVGFKKRSLDPSLSTFLLSLIRAVLYILVVITIASMVGIETTSFVAVLGAASLAVGFALQGT